jgi:hypothetical protein
LDFVYHQSLSTKRVFGSLHGDLRCRAEARCQESAAFGIFHCRLGPKLCFLYLVTTFRLITTDRRNQANCLFTTVRLVYVICFVTVVRRNHIPDLFTTNYLNHEFRLVLYLVDANIPIELLILAKKNAFDLVVQESWPQNSLYSFCHHNPLTTMGIDFDSGNLSCLRTIKPKFCAKKV